MNWPDLSDDGPAFRALRLFMVFHVMKNLHRTSIAAVSMTTGFDSAKFGDVFKADQTTRTCWSCSWWRLSCCRLCWGRLLDHSLDWNGVLILWIVNVWVKVAVGQ